MSFTNSNIDPTVPQEGVVVQKQAVRDNFAAAKEELDYVLQLVRPARAAAFLADNAYEIEILRTQAGQASAIAGETASLTTRLQWALDDALAEMAAQRNTLKRVTTRQRLPITMAFATTTAM